MIPLVVLNATKIQRPNDRSLSLAQGSPMLCLIESANDKIPVVPLLHGRADCAYGSDIFPMLPIGTS
jgi:hypothetical protein